MTPLLIPDVLWQRLLDEFARHHPAVERVAFLDGIHVPTTTHTAAGTGDDTETVRAAPHGRVAVVTTLILPNAQLTPGWYRIAAAAMSTAGAHLRAFGLARLAQVHTHGDTDTWHSPVDDTQAYSQRPGALSIVLPHHARHRPAPCEGGVHVREVDGWRRLQPTHADQLVRLIPAVLDFREPSCLIPADAPPTSPTDTCGPLEDSIPPRPRRPWWTWRSRRACRT